MNSLTEITARRAALNAEAVKIANDYAKWKDDFTAEMKSLVVRERLIVAGLNLARLDRGRKIIRVIGRAGDERPKEGSAVSDRRAQAVRDARNDLVNGALKLRHRYIGIKNYDSFGDQREDHEYGNVPRHGRIVFMIELASDVRDRLNGGGVLTNAEIEDALYVLVSLGVVEAAEKAA